MKNSNVILYTPGAYGHFINWCCDYFSGNLIDHTIPINDLGNCHGCQEVKLLALPPQFKEFTESDEFCNFILIHEFSFDYIDQFEMYSEQDVKNVLTRNFTYLQDNYKKSIYIYSTINSMIWHANNYLFKHRWEDYFKNINEAEKYFIDQNEIDPAFLYHGVDKIKKQFNFNTKDLKGWNHQSIDEFDHWEFREFASKYYFDKIRNYGLNNNILLEQELIQKYPNIKFIRMDDLKNKFEYTIHSILEFFNLDIVNWENINRIHQSWLGKQYYINSDLQVHQIITALLNKENLDWKNWELTFIDELCIQRLLFDNNISIKCWGLNTLPTNTKDFLPLLEKIQ